MRTKQRFYAWIVLGFVAVAGSMLARCDCGDKDDRQSCCWFGVDAGTDIDAEVEQLVMLRAGVSVSPVSSDLCNSELEKVQVHWEQYNDDAPPVRLDEIDRLTAAFTPTVGGVYTFCATLSTDLLCPSLVPQTDCVSVWVEEVCFPIADAGEDTTIRTTSGTPQTITLDGSGSHSDAACYGSAITGYDWKVVSQPAGSDVVIHNHGDVQATAELLVPGSYEFRLDVSDSDRRVGTDIVVFTLVQCWGDLVVTAVDALDGRPLQGAHVFIVDAAGTSHAADTDTGGAAEFALAPGACRSISVVSDEMVPPLPGAGGPDRPRYETTTVLDHCADSITIPVRLTDSGAAARLEATVVARVPDSIFAMLPHSWKCSGSCSSSGDCQETYYCERSTAPCVDKCTPRSLLPFFGLGSEDLSGQIRFVMLLPVLPPDDAGGFDLRRLYAPPNGEDAFWPPGNLATDDTFLNGMWRSFGIVPLTDIPCDPTMPGDWCPPDYVCDETAWVCRDKYPMHNLRMKAPAGEDVPLVLLMGIMNVSMVELLPILLPFLTADGDAELDVAGLHRAFHMRTLHVCLLHVEIQAGEENDITPALAALGGGDCWEADFQQQEVIEPIRDDYSVKPSNECQTDDDCDWPDSGKKCRPDPQDPENRYCFVPMFRVQILSSDEMKIYPDTTTGFDPLSMKADARMCEHLPATTQHEVKCRGENDLPVACDGGPVYCDIPVSPDETECAWSYGLALASLEFPRGHSRLPDGGRVVVGFDFNRTPLFESLNTGFLVPPLESTGGAALRVEQLFIRHVSAMPDGNCATMTGRLGASAVRDGSVTMLELPPFMPPPDPGLLPDAGFQTRVTLILADPFAECGSVTAEKIYAVATSMLEPQVGHALPGEVNAPVLPHNALKGLLLGRVDREPAGGAAYQDRWWRIYAPPGAPSISIPPEVSPFSSGQEVWITPWSASFEEPFDYDSFVPDRILGFKSAYSEDSWALIVP